MTDSLITFANFLAKIYNWCKEMIKAFISYVDEWLADQEFNSAEHPMLISREGKLICVDKWGQYEMKGFAHGS